VASIIIPAPRQAQYQFTPEEHDETALNQFIYNAAYGNTDFGFNNHSQHELLYAIEQVHVQ
jgi:hypothetical protein